MLGDGERTKLDALLMFFPMKAEDMLLGECDGYSTRVGCGSLTMSTNQSISRAQKSNKCLKVHLFRRGSQQSPCQSKAHFSLRYSFRFDHQSEYRCLSASYGFAPDL